MKLAIVEIHDVCPFYEKETYLSIKLLEELKIKKFSLLLIPNYNKAYPVDRYRNFISYLKELNQEIILHGLTHRGRMKISHLLYTYREGEFGDLDRENTAERIAEAVKLLQEVSLKTDLFIPPAWIGNPWLEEVLSAFGFKGVAYRRAIKFLINGRSIHSPVLTFSNRFMLSYLSIKAIPAMLRLSQNSQVMRLALHTKDFRDPRKVELWQAILTSAKKHRRFVNYEELMGEG